jgi:DNA invertase Pin-like site-specific DNA recombinase
MFQMLGVFAEFERSLIRSRVMAGLERTRAKGTRLGRPPLDPGRAEAIRALLAVGVGIRETARRTGVGASTVQRMHAAMIASRSEGTNAAAA